MSNLTSTSLSQILPPSAILANSDAYSIDGIAPALALKSQSEDELLEVLSACNAQAAAVVPWGGGTHMDLGMPLTRYDVSINLTALNAILEYEPADLTVSVQAGMRLADLQHLLGKNGQWLPLDPPTDEAATIGGILAVNASGPGRAVYGTARDLLIGIAVATPEGETVRAGGRVVKNVAGYDLGKLHIGALGTLGVITRASFKVSPLPEVMRTVEASSPDPKSLLIIATEARRRGLALNRLVLTQQGVDEWHLLLRLAGGAAAVESSQLRLDGLAAVHGASFTRADESVWSQLSTFQQTDVVVKAAVMPSATGAVLDQLKSLGAVIIAYPTTGVVYGAWRAGVVTPDSLKDLRRLCGQAGRGALILEKAPADLRVAIDVWGDTRGDFTLMRSLKDKFDPAGTLNPGRFVGSI